MNKPSKGKKIEIKVRTEDVSFRKETFSITYPCPYHLERNEFIDDIESLEIKEKLVCNKYRDRFNLPFPEEIKEIRSMYKLSATKMSELLGFGVNSYRNYENGEVPSHSNANLIQLASDPRKFKSLILISSLFDDNADERENILKSVNELIQEKGREENMFFEGFEDYLLGKNLPDLHTGYIKPNLSKLTEMIVFFAENFKPFKTQLNKLLFYSDFYHYRMNAASISGTRYRAIDRGPVPDNYDSIFDYVVRNENVKIKETVWANGFSEQFVPSQNRVFNSNLFSPDEILVLEKVNEFFDGKSTKEVVDISHEEDAWIENYQNGKILIDYKYAFNLKNMS